MKREETFDINRFDRTHFMTAETANAILRRNGCFSAADMNGMSGADFGAFAAADTPPPCDNRPGSSTLFQPRKQPADGSRALSRKVDRNIAFRHAIICAGKQEGFFTFHKGQIERGSAQIPPDGAGEIGHLFRREIHHAAYG